MKTILYIFGITCLLGLYTCSHDQFEIETSTSSSSPTLGVTVSLDEMLGESALRAKVAPEQGEEEVGSLFLYFFEENDSREGLFVDYIEVAGPLTMNSRYTLETKGTAINVSDAYHVIAIANIDDDQYIAGDVETWNAQWEGKNEEYFRTKALAGLSEATDESDNSKAIANDKILMNGTTVKKAMDGEIAIDLIRNVARFDVINSVDNEYDLVSASIWNAFPRSSVTGDAVLEYAKSQDTRVARFYGVDNTENIEEDGTLGDIRGGLYTFENKVTSPAVDDKYTTCLIVGLKNRDTEKVGYYRVNINPSESPQNLKRNNVYKLNITGVVGEGAADESEAYTSTKRELTYVVNNWDLGDNGLVISDQYSILAVPVKTVKIGAEGGEFSYPITTFSSLTSPDPLAMKSQSFDPSTGTVTASLSGSTLIVRAEPLASDGEPINGVVTVSFAGLEAQINVEQSTTDTYLNVTLEDTWVSKIGSLAGVASEYIYVNASDTWTAELFGEGFSFSSEVEGTPVTTLKSTSLEDSKFKVYTHSQNGADEERKAFILISIDSDPVNYVSALSIFQKVAGVVKIIPDTDEIVFGGNRVISSPSGVTEFTVSTVGEYVITGAELSGTNADKFAVNLPVGSLSSTMTVTANGNNASGEAFVATLLIKDSSGASKSVSLRQNSLALTVQPNSYSTIAVVGGQTGLITVSTGDPSSEFIATVDTESATSGKTLYGHNAFFIDENGEDIDLSEAVPIDTKFKVKFPKVYFPNRDIDITATVTIAVANSVLTKTISIDQTSLRAKPIKIWNSTDDWGGSLMEENYFEGFRAALVSIVGEDAIISDNNDDGSMEVPAGVNYLHMSNEEMDEDYEWTNTNKFLENTDGVFLYAGDGSDSEKMDAINSNNSPMRKNGYTLITNSSEKGELASLHSNLANTRIGRFFTSKGLTPITGSITNFFYDERHTALGEYPASATPILQRADGKVIMTVDPKNKIVYIGDGEVFGYTNRFIDGGRAEFRDNVVQYVINAAMYGSHFTDLLREDLGLPEVWEDVWGANKWPDSN